MVQWGIIQEDRRGLASVTGLLAGIIAGVWLHAWAIGVEGLPLAFGMAGPTASAVAHLGPSALT